MFYRPAPSVGLNSWPKAAPTVPRPKSRAPWVLLAGMWLSGCLGPQVDDAVPNSAIVFPTRIDEVPTVSERPELLAQIDKNDGVGRRVRRLSGFAGGQRVWFWRFGLARAETVPLYLLVRQDAEAAPQPVEGHPPIFDVVPGDSGYSPYWQVVLVPVTERWAGEQLTSLKAIQDAHSAGLVGESVETQDVVNCPVVHPDVRLEVGGGQPDAAPKTAYYQGARVFYFGFETLTVTDDTHTIPVRLVAMVQRDDGPPLDEPWRHVDMTGDGDKNDTNDVFSNGPGDSDYSPLRRIRAVTVTSEAQCVDSFQDEEKTDLAAWADLFDADDRATPGRVIAWREDGRLLNWPVEPPPQQPTSQRSGGQP